MTLPRRTAAALAFVLLLSVPLRAGVPISNGTWSAEINRVGVLTRVPSGGIKTLDGPRVDLLPGFAEWYGVSFDGPEGPMAGVACGAAPDWAARALIPPGVLSSAAGVTLVVTRLGPLDIETRFEFDPDLPWLTVAVTLTNRGTMTLRNVFYTREWHQPGDAGWTFPPDLPLPPAPPGICRAAWMLRDLPPGGSDGIGLSYAPSGDASLAGTDVPLALWTHEDFPDGLVLGSTNGVSFGDYDGDGWIDLFAMQSGNLWRNVSGQTWELTANLRPLLPPAAVRYGSSFGDYDQDGLADIGTEPRTNAIDTCFHLLHNLGGGPNFVNVATDPAIVDVQPCSADSETICWGDTDGDQNLDLFLPVYPPTGNFFLHNLGPTGPGGAYRFTERSAEAGLDNPPDVNRPEGAQFVDIDSDGDLDLYSNDVLYQNRTPLGGPPTFGAMEREASGLGLRGQLEEGALFLDYDMDGDQDLAIAYVSGMFGVRIWENRGDGTLFHAGDEIIQARRTGLGLGMSAEDWDNDGDVDMTTREVFRRNMLVETGQRRFLVATHSIPASHLTSATPAWGDWDRDGDLDCALGNWMSIGHFYENVLHGADTPEAQRRYVRIRPVGDSAAVPGGLETEYGATVEIHVPGASLRRRKFTSSAAGYLNQNEYALHFALPGSGDGATSDLRFDVAVDFPSLPEQGYRRVDRHVNPALGQIRLADLADREITVYRSGRVAVQGCLIDPKPPRTPLLATTTDGLALATPTTGLPPTFEAATPNRFVGLDLSTAQAAGRVRVKELILDGQLDAAVDCGGTPFNVALWDVTTGSPVLARRLALATSERNRRTHFPVSIVLQPGRHYRLVARVTRLRRSPVNAPVQNGPLTVFGGLSFRDDDPCSGASVLAATTDPSRVPLAIRAAETGGPFFDLGHGRPGTHGVPVLAASGNPVGGSLVTLRLTGALAQSPTCTFIGLSLACRPLLGDALLPSADFLLPGMTDTEGTLTLPFPWPQGRPPGFTLFFQTWIVDPVGQPASASNTVAVVSEE